MPCRGSVPCSTSKQRIPSSLSPSASSSGKPLCPTSPLHPRQRVIERRVGCSYTASACKAHVAQPIDGGSQSNRCPDARLILPQIRSGYPFINLSERGGPSLGFRHGFCALGPVCQPRPPRPAVSAVPFSSNLQPVIAQVGSTASFGGRSERTQWTGSMGSIGIVDSHL